MRAAIDAFEARDRDAICEQLSHRAHVVIGHAAHGKRPVDCQVDIRNYVKWIAPHRKGATRVTAVERTSGATATATVRLPGGEAVRVKLSEEDGDWKLDGLFDASLSFIQIRHTPGEDRLAPETVTPGKRSAARGDRSVAQGAARGDGRPCPPVDTSRFPVLAGGCVIVGEDTRFALSVRTPFGVMDFAECEVNYDVIVDGRARAWVDSFSIGGSSPCLDVMPCRTRSRDKVPWPATFRRTRGGQVRLEVDDVCLDTCIGRFVGSWQAEVVERQDGWRLRSADAMVGDTGWVMSGSVRVKGTPVKLSFAR